MGLFFAPPAAAVFGAALRGKHPRRRWRRSAHCSGTHRTPTHQPPRAQLLTFSVWLPPSHPGRHFKRYCVRCLTRARRGIDFFKGSLSAGWLRLLWIASVVFDWWLSGGGLKSFNSRVAFATNERFYLKKIHYLCTNQNQMLCPKSKE